MDKPFATFIYKIKDKSKTAKANEIKPLFKFTLKKRECEESIRCDDMDSKFFGDGEIDDISGNKLLKKAKLKQNTSSTGGKKLREKETKPIPKGEKILQTKVSQTKVKKQNTFTMRRPGDRSAYQITKKKQIKPVIAKDNKKKQEARNTTENVMLKQEQGVYNDETEINNDIAKMHKHESGNIPEEQIANINILDNEKENIAFIPPVKKSKLSQALKVSPLEYHHLVNESDSAESKINKIIKMSVEYLSKHDSSFKDLDLNIEFKDSTEEKINKIECEIEGIKEEIKKWEGIGNDFVKKSLQEGIKYIERPQKVENVKAVEEDEPGDFVAQNQEKIHKLAAMMRKYIGTCKNECEEMYKKMFAMVKRSELDPLLVLKTLAKLKKMDN